LTSCECDSLIDSYDIEDSTQNSTIDNFNSTDYEEKLESVKEAWVKYKRFANQLKKYEKKIEKLNNLYYDFLDTAAEAFLNGDECDMTCSYGCMANNSKLKKQLKCIKNDCQCTFNVDIEEVINELKEESEDLKNEDEDTEETGKKEDEEQYTSTETVYTWVNCNITCTEQCDAVADYLDDSGYSDCMSEMCGCEK
jgi:hypothetical protein